MTNYTQNSLEFKRKRSPQILKNDEKNDRGV